jgi:zinc transport system substrate-binding protein
MRGLLTLPVLAGLLALPGCVATPAADGKVRIVAGLYPLAYVARQVGGARAHVTDLTPAGAEPHDVELSPSQVAAVRSAAVVLAVRGLQPAVDQAAPAKATLDAFAGLSERREGGVRDPHVWLDPTRLAALGTTLARRLADVDPAHDTEYLRNALALSEELTTIDREYRAGLAHCARTDVVTSHAAFGYLADRYGLRQVGIAGLSPDAEPSPSRIASAARYVRAHHVTTVFFESLVSPKVARTVARETGATTAVLDPVESVRDGDDYRAVMRRNLATLRAALGCA